MRLIDADTLPIVTRGKNNHRKYVFADITDAPTIAAIPMDWMDAQIHGYAARLQSTELKALLIVKGLWEKDQEAKS